jgi:hypothetical protein
MKDNECFTGFERFYLLSFSAKKRSCFENFVTDIASGDFNYVQLLFNFDYYYLFSLALQPSAAYGILSLCSPAQAMASCRSAAQRGLWPPVVLQPSAGYGLLSLCSPAQAMAS